MHRQLERPDDFGAWREEARACIQHAIAPEAITWSVQSGPQDLFAHSDPSDLFEPLKQAPVIVPRRFIELARSACLHRDAARFGLLYRLLWRLQRKRDLMDDLTDLDVRALYDFARTVRRDIHKMRAFVRFRGVTNDLGEEAYFAWFEPEHYIVRANAAFFHARFAGMRWTIITPETTLIWDGNSFTEGPGGVRCDVPMDDAIEDLWKEYYRAIFNPARLKIGAMTKEMPKKYWANMPETALINDMVANARNRELQMIADSPSIPATRPSTMKEVRAALSRCTRCSLHCNATQAVAGEGPETARLMIVGEQPGEEEDHSGRPFVGPAGQLLESALRNIGVERRAVYVTNAVKHFKYRREGRKRLHQTPNANEIDLCRWWLDLERHYVRPKVIIALGASAARGLLGRTHNVETLRRQPTQMEDGTQICVTYHPSYILRLPDERKNEVYTRFLYDLNAAQALLQ